jgi:hypothetical protein
MTIEDLRFLQTCFGTGDRNAVRSPVYIGMTIESPVSTAIIGSMEVYSMKSFSDCNPYTITQLTSQSHDPVLFSTLLALVAPTWLLLHSLGASAPRNASSLFPRSSTCCEQCKNLFTLGIAFEYSQHINTPRDDFYTITINFPRSMKPGLILRTETHTNLVNHIVPSIRTMSRFMYTSESLNRTVVLVSAFVLRPYSLFDYSSHGTKQNAKFPKVAWANWTSGQFHM